jgi:hypothetical protein
MWVSITWGEWDPLESTPYLHKKILTAQRREALYESAFHRCGIEAAGTRT